MLLLEDTLANVRTIVNVLFEMVEIFRTKELIPCVIPSFEEKFNSHFYPIFS